MKEFLILHLVSSLIFSDLFS